MNTRKQFLEQVRIIFGPLKWRIILVLSGIALVQVLAIFNPYFQGLIVDNLTKGKPMSDTVRLIVIAGITMLASHWLIQYQRETYEVRKIDFDIDERAEDHTMDKMLQLSVGQHNSIHSGLKHSVVSRGKAALTSLVFMSVFEIIPTLSRVLIMAVALCWISLSMGLVVTGSMFLYLGLSALHNFLSSSKLVKLEKMWNQESKFRNEIIQHVGHIITNAQEKKARAEADKKYEEAIGIARPFWLGFLNIAYSRSTIPLLTRVAILFLGVRQYYEGDITLGQMVTFWAWSNNALDGIYQIGHTQRQIMKMWSSIRRYCEFLALEGDVRTVPNPIILESVRGHIEVRNLSFAYNTRKSISSGDDDDNDLSQETEKSNHPALQNVSFTVKAGETVAIVGESGSGKTTLASLLLRASDPTEGAILIDGYDLRILDPKRYREQVGVVEQHVPLFDRTIRENILYGMSEESAEKISPAELEYITGVSQINRFKHKLEQGFDTVIGERGIKLSGGERQRVGIARALIKNPAILIFDEATSSLDAKVEADIREAINEASRGRTTIIIAHRFSTIRYANRIIVMDQGRVVGEGTHAQLYQTCAPYRELVNHQLDQIDH